LAQNHPEYPDHPTRSAEEQEAHDQVVGLLAQRLQEEGFTDVRTNLGQSRENAIEVEGQTTLYPDVFTLEGDAVTTICEVETPSTVHPDSVPQWKDYASLGATFLLVVPQETAETAYELIQEHEIPCQNILTYQWAPAQPEP